MYTTDIVGAWFAVFLTLAIFSFLYKDNPFYKAAEHIFVGVSAGYWASTFFWTQIQPNLFGRLWPKLEAAPHGLKAAWYGIYNFLHIFHHGIFPTGGIDKGHTIDLFYLVPLFMLFRLSRKLGWMARWSMAYVVGLAAGLRLYGFLNSNILAQIRGSAMPLFDGWGTAINSLILLTGTLTGLFYFFFSKEHTGVFGKISRIGIWFLMVSFGAAFGFTVMGRISLLIGRFNDLIEYSHANYHYATWWILALIVVLLGFQAFRDRGKNTEQV